MFPMSVRLVTPLLLAIACAVQAAAPDGSPDRRREGLVRILSVFDAQPVRYKQTSNGKFVPAFAAFDEEPPPVMYLKIGDTYDPKPLIRNAVSHPHLNPRGKTEGIQGYFIRVFGQSDGLEEFSISMGAKPAQTRRKTKEVAPKFALMSKPAPADGKDYLLCVYQPDPSAKWFVPKSLFIDISHDKFPLGSCLVINLGNLPVLAKIGASTTAIRLEPGASSYVPPPSGNTGAGMSFKMAAPGKQGPEIIFDRIRDIPSDARALFVAYSAFDKKEGKPILAKLCPINEPPKDVSATPSRSLPRVATP